MRYRNPGFHLDSPLKYGVIYRTAASVTIVKGDALHDDGSGLATNAIIELAATFLGIAAADCAASGTVPIIPPSPDYYFWVVNSGSTVLATSDIGEIVDLEACNTIDSSDEDVAGWGFQIDEIDISAEALAADNEAATAGGFAKGHFTLKRTS
jgi:hypothetical protein